MNDSTPKVLIGPMSADRSESVSEVNRAFVRGLSDQFEFIVIETTREHGTTRQSLLTAWNLWYFLKHVSAWLVRLLCCRPDIAHYAVSSGWAMEKSLFLLSLAGWCGARTLGHLHSGGFLDHWVGLPDWRRRLALHQLRRLDGFVVLSDWWRVQVVELVGLSRDKVWVVNNPIDPGFEDAALSLPVERKEGRILSIGTIGRDKGVFELLEACRILKEEGLTFQLDLAGPERDLGIRARLAEQLEKNGCENEVLLEEGVFGDAKIKMFRECSIFVLPSYYENFPLVVLEAAAAGHAIITTPVGAVPEFFEDGVSALFVNPRDSRQLAEAISCLLNDPRECRRLGEGARTVFRRRLARRGILESLADVYSAACPSPVNEVTEDVTRARANGTENFFLSEGRPHLIKSS